MLPTISITTIVKINQGKKKMKAKGIKENEKNKTKMITI